jgi:hypothetical protein
VELHVSDKWEWAKGYDGMFLISNRGEIISVPRVDKLGHKRRGKFISSKVDNNGYLKCGLFKDGIVYTHRIHRLVYESFKGLIPDYLVIDHVDGDKLNNDIRNLEAVSTRENTSRGFERKDTASRYVGVSRNGKKWRSRIELNGAVHYLGNFKTEDEASDAYQKALVSITGWRDTPTSELNTSFEVDE